MKLYQIDNKLIVSEIEMPKMTYHYNKAFGGIDVEEIPQTETYNKAITEWKKQAVEVAESEKEKFIEMAINFSGKEDYRRVLIDGISIKPEMTDYFIKQTLSDFKKSITQPKKEESSEAEIWDDVRAIISYTNDVDAIIIELKKNFKINKPKTTMQNKNETNIEKLKSKFIDEWKQEGGFDSDEDCWTWIEKNVLSPQTKGEGVKYEDGCYRSAIVEEAWDFIKRTAVVIGKNNEGATFSCQQVIRALNKMDEMLSLPSQQVEGDNKEGAKCKHPYYKVYNGLCNECGIKFNS